MEMSSKSFQCERKAIAAQLRCIGFRAGTQTFSQTSSSTRLLRFVLEAAYFLMFDLLSHDESLGGRRRYRGWLSQSKDFDVLDFHGLLKRCDAYLKHSLHDAKHFPYRPRTYEQFKAVVHEGTKHWGYVGAFRPIIIRYFERRDVQDFRLLSTWFNFLARVNLPDLDLEDQAEKDYVAFEDGYLEDYDVNLLGDLRKYITKWFRTCSLEHFVPKHGPGSVAGAKGRLPIALKYQMMACDPLLKYLEKDIGPLDTWTPLPLLIEKQRRSEIVCVPKSMTTNRVISREPVSLQYFQQAYKAVIVDHIHKRCDLRHHVRFNRQDLSQVMAKAGSVDGSLATIDLSNASDSVSFTLVKELFKRCPLLLRGLWATRSTHTTLPSGRVLKIRKFAPMGSALCFPVQTIVFSACCALACANAGIHAKYRVYGDDIVIDVRAVDALLRILTSLHFHTNVTKSFYERLPRWNFREACGAEYLDGIDVAPFRVPRFLKSCDNAEDATAEEITSYISFANTAYERGYHSTRRCILLYLKEHYSGFESLLFSEDGKRGIHTYPSSGTNWKLPSRFIMELPSPCKRNVYQRLERQCNTINITRDCEWCRIAATRRYRYKTTCPVKGQQPDWEVVRYFEWHRRKASVVLIPNDGYKGQKPYAYDRDDSHHGVPPFLRDMIADEECSICPSSPEMKRSWVLI